MLSVPAASADPALRFSHFELIPAERVLRMPGKPVNLGSRAFDLLPVLAQRHPRLVSKQELLDRVWPGLVVAQHSIATQIGKLRKLLGSSALATLPGYGCRSTAQPMTPPASAPSPATRPRHNLPDPRTRCIGCEAARVGLAAVQAAGSVRVFVDRARLALPDVEVDASNAAPSAKICRRLDGIALAIELAAARVTMLPLAAIRAREACAPTAPGCRPPAAAC